MYSLFECNLPLYLFNPVFHFVFIIRFNLDVNLSVFSMRRIAYIRNEESEMGAFILKSTKWKIITLTFKLWHFVAIVAEWRIAKIYKVIVARAVYYHFYCLCHYSTLYLTNETREKKTHSSSRKCSVVNVFRKQFWSVLSSRRQWEASSRPQ